MTNKQHGFLSVPVAIIIAGLIIGAAVIYATKSSAPKVIEPTPPRTEGVDNLKPITTKDHILGDINAPVKIVEFSDTECPFCKRFHPTLQQVMAEYSRSGKVAWVYRHFPLAQLHPKAPKEAEATECANELGGNTKFWAYLDRLMEVTPSNNRLDSAELPNIAEFVGLDRGKFESCLSSGKYAGHVEADYQDAVASGGRGTPYSIVVAKNGQKFPISGAQSYAEVKQVVETALNLK